MGTLLGNLRLTFAIPAMTIAALGTAMLAVLGGLYLSLSGTVERDTEAAVVSTTRVASQILQVNLPSVEIVLNEQGGVEGLLARSMPRLRTYDVIDTVARVSGQDAALYTFDAEAGPDFTVGSTSLLLANGERLIDSPIPAGSELFETLASNVPARRSAVIEDTRYVLQYQPIATVEGQVIGALMVAVDRGPIEAVLFRSMLLIGATGGLAMLVIALGALLVARRLTHPIPALAEAMESIANGNLDSPVPYVEARNEIGAMARAVEVFRANGLEKAALDVQARQHLLEAADHTGQLQAIGRSQIVVEFALDGTVLTANENFLNLVGYDLAPIISKPNAFFLFDADPSNQVYKQFWLDLAAGQFKSGEYRRRTSAGGEVWIQSTFTPICDTSGMPYKVVQFATEVTARKQTVAAIGAALKRLADGDLGHLLVDPFPPEFEDLRFALNGTIERFADVVGRLQQTTRALRVASGELLSGANDLSERTTRQAATIEETSAAMEELSHTVASNADMAQEAAHKAQSVARSTAESSAVMGEVSQAMERITQSSSRIANIIGMIDDIAFQTNLLALNASVEAARAGDAGKGFAVVAIEVRRLAQGAAQASAEVKALVDHSDAEVRGGTDLVLTAENKLRAMREAVDANAALVQAIASACREQASSIEEVNTAVRTLDQMTQHNASLVEETNAVIEQTEGQTHELDRLVDLFRLGDEVPPIQERRAA